MPLELYKKKRKFSGKSKTTEPKGKVVKGKSKQLIFVIHEHHASHLHWDLRLEMEGVLKSWAVPKSPPLDKKTKRLAIMVEDHPLEYATFRGVIPEGHYGAGEVKIWDNGKYELISKDKNKIEIIFHGKKLKGKYILLKTKYGHDENSKAKSWLWFKVE